jgi:two-component system osmolarity sensor histidine kinase EnvZ
VAQLRFRPFARIRELLPKGLYARSLIIIIAPVVLLQGAVSYIFFERHWTLVTRRLSSAVAAEIAFVVDTGVYQGTTPGKKALEGLAERDLGLKLSFAPGGTLPKLAIHSLLEQTINDEVQKVIRQPFWFDVVRRESQVDIRVQLKTGVLQAIVRRSRVYATNWHIFLVWMVITSVLLLGIAILFLRNQVRPILRLAYAAQAMGKGREVPFRPAGAREVRIAAQAFIDMRDRLKRYVEQRTEMLAGVSHDLRTPLTRMKLHLALIKDNPEIAELRSEIAEMEHMLDEYLDFVRGAGGEEPQFIDLSELLAEICEDAGLKGRPVTLKTPGALHARVRRQAMKRCIANLVENALAHARTVQVALERRGDMITIAVDDDGPGIAPDQREDVFRPFVRLDQSRNPNTGGVGLGLTIARDIARSHGGDVTLSQSPLGGLRAAVTLPF